MDVRAVTLPWPFPRRGARKRRDEHRCVPLEASRRDAGKLEVEVEQAPVVVFVQVERPRTAFVAYDGDTPADCNHPRCIRVTL